MTQPERPAGRVTITRSELAAAMDTLCHGVVTRRGQLDVCCKRTTTVIFDRESASLWSACTYHAHRYGGTTVLPLAVIQRAQVDGAAEFTYTEE